MCSSAARQKVTTVVHDGHPHWNVANAGAKIDQCILCTDHVPCIYICNPHLEFERCCHAVGSLDSILAVLVQVNKARRYNKSARIECRSAPQPFRTDRLDLASANANIANGIEAGFWVNDTTVEDHMS